MKRKSVEKLLTDLLTKLHELNSEGENFYIIMEKIETLIIGGGPAGLMAAVRASSLGQRVVILEKNASLGEKLLISGRRRCNFMFSRASTVLHQSSSAEAIKLFKLLSKLALDTS